MTNGMCPQQDFKKLCESMNLPTPEFKSVSDFTHHTQVVFEFHEDMEETALQLLSAFETRLKKSASRKTSKDENKDNAVSGMIEARKRIMRTEMKANIQTVEKTNSSNNPFSLITQSKNKISALMEYAQKKKTELPVFDEQSQSSNSPLFSCRCTFNSITDIGTSTNKKAAKEDSARLILLKLDITTDSITKRVKPSPSVEDLTTRFSNTNIGEKDIVSRVNEWYQKRQIPIPDYTITEHDLELKSSGSLFPQDGSYDNICMTDTGKKTRNKLFSCVGKYKQSNYHTDHPISSSRILDATRLTEHVVEGDTCNSKKEAKKNCAKKLYAILVEENK